MTERRENYKRWTRGQGGAPDGRGVRSALLFDRLRAVRRVQGLDASRLPGFERRAEFPVCVRDVLEPRGLDPPVGTVA